MPTGEDRWAWIDDHHGDDEFVSVQYLTEAQRAYKQAYKQIDKIFGQQYVRANFNVDKVGTKIKQALHCLSGDLDYSQRAEAKGVLKDILSELGME